MVRSIEEAIVKLRAEIQEADDKALRAREVGDRDKWILWLRESQQLREKQLQLMKERAEQINAQPGAYLSASAQPAMQKLWDQLQAVQQLTKIGNAHFLELGSVAQISDEVPSRLLVRECYVGLSNKLHDYLMGPGHIFIVVGSPGIGKGLFLCYLMWELARLKQTFIYEKRDAKTLVLFTPTRVSEGSLTAFRAELDDPQTWYLVDGHPPMVVEAKTVLVTPPDWDVWKDTIKRPNCIWRYMPTWAPEEIETARHWIFNSQPKTEVDDRLKRWGGVPLFVLQKTDLADQAMLQDALNSCSLSNFVSCMADLSHASGFTHMLLHQTVSAGYLRGPVEFALEWVKEELVARYMQFDQREVQRFLATSGGTPTIIAYRMAIADAMGIHPTISLTPALQHRFSRGSAHLPSDSDDH